MLNVQRRFKTEKVREDLHEKSFQESLSKVIHISCSRWLNPNIIELFVHKLRKRLGGKL